MTILLTYFLGYKFILDLGLQLNRAKNDGGMGNLIVKSHKAFEDYKKGIINDLLGSMNIEDMIKSLEGHPSISASKKAEWQGLYVSFQESYSTLIDKSIGEDDNIEDIVQEAKYMARRGDKNSAEVRDIMVYVFAAWSLLDKSSFQRALKAGNKK